jgi:hypothetical protein
MLGLDAISETAISALVVVVTTTTQTEFWGSMGL